VQRVIVALDHTQWDTPTQARAIGLLWTRDRLVADNTQKSQEKDIHAPGRQSKPQSHSKRAATDPRLRSHDQVHCIVLILCIDSLHCIFVSRSFSLPASHSLIKVKCERRYPFFLSHDITSVTLDYISCFSLQPGHYSSLTAPYLQHTANQERYDQCGNQHHSREFLMMSIIMLETC